MTSAEVCSYLRGRLQMRVQVLENGQYLLSPLPRDAGTISGKTRPECWDLPNLCEHYGIPLWKVGLAPAPIPATGNVFIKLGTIPGEGERCPKCGTVRPNNTPGACRLCDEAWDAGERVKYPSVEYPAMVELGPDTKPCMAAGDGVVCTREQGHSGDHAAHNLRGEMVRRWPSVSVAVS